MSYILPDTAPAQVVRGTTSVVTFRIYDASETAPSITTVSTVVSWGSTTVGTYTPTWSAPSATLTLTIPGSDTSGLTLGDTPLRAIHSPLIGGATVALEQRLVLVRRNTYPGVLSSDLTARYPELADLATTAELRADLVAAWQDVRQGLLDQGVEWWRVRDADALARLTRLRAAGERYARAAQDTGDERWHRHAHDLRAEYAMAMSAPMAVDADEDDVTDTQPAHAQPAVDWWSTERRS